MNSKPINRMRTILFSCLVFIAVGCQDSVELPEYLTYYHSDLLNKAKDNLNEENSSCLRTAYNQLISSADELLEEPCPSVVQKKRVPPSGNKHDYISVGPYWWPDTTKPDGLPYIRRDGELNPDYYSDDTDHASLRKMLEMGETLTMAYYFSGKEKYAEKASICLRVWFLDEETRMNPHLRFGQAIPGLNNGRFTGIIETRHLGRIGDLVNILLNSEHWNQEDHEKMKTWFEQYLDWLVHSDFGIQEAGWPNSHGTWFDVQASGMAQLTGKQELAREILEEVKTRRLDKQLTPQGGQPHELERIKSLSHSIMNLRGYYHLGFMAEHEGIDLWQYKTVDNPGIKGATDFLVQHALKNEWPYQQMGETAPLKEDLVELLFLAKNVYDTKEYDVYINDLKNKNCDNWEILLFNGYKY
ncbi:MAG: alginate lyase family protein [Bacteroidota bacterium]